MKSLGNPQLGYASPERDTGVLGFDGKVCCHLSYCGYCGGWYIIYCPCLGTSHRWSYVLKSESLLNQYHKATFLGRVLRRFLHWFRSEGEWPSLESIRELRTLVEQKDEEAAKRVRDFNMAREEVLARSD